MKKASPVALELRDRPVGVLGADTPRPRGAGAAGDAGVGDGALLRAGGTVEVERAGSAFASGRDEALPRVVAPQSSLHSDRSSQGRRQGQKLVLAVAGLPGLPA